MANPAARLDVRYTYADYLTWPANERWELISGTPYAMSPAPSRKHQAITLELSRIIANHIKAQGGPCKVYAAPFDVRLPQANQAVNEIDTVVQPDIVIICDATKLDDKGCLGTPDLVVEIVSPATVRKDMIEKLNLYEQHGVKEYWLVFPKEQLVSVYQLDDNKAYGKPEVYTTETPAPIEILTGLVVNLAEVFAAE